MSRPLTGHGTPEAEGCVVPGISQHICQAFFKTAAYVPSGPGRNHGKHSRSRRPSPACWLGFSAPHNHGQRHQRSTPIPERALRFCSNRLVELCCSFSGSRMRMKLRMRSDWLRSIPVEFRLSKMSCGSSVWRSSATSTITRRPMPL